MSLHTQAWKANIDKRKRSPNENILNQLSGTLRTFRLNVHNGCILLTSICYTGCGISMLSVRSVQVYHQMWYATGLCSWAITISYFHTWNVIHRLVYIKVQFQCNISCRGKTKNSWLNILIAQNTCRLQFAYWCMEGTLQSTNRDLLAHAGSRGQCEEAWRQWFR